MPSIRSESETGIVNANEAQSTGHFVCVLPDGLRLNFRPAENIVDAVRRQGYRTRYSCRRGGCGLCKAELVQGEIRYHAPVAETVLSSAERAEGMCLPCRAIPVGDVVIRLSERDTLRNIFGSTRHTGTAG